MPRQRPSSSLWTDVGAREPTRDEPRSASLPVYSIIGIFNLVNPKHMEKAAPLVSELMKVLSNRHRLMILCQLVEGEKSVGELAHALDLRQAALSQQLALLRKGGLVRTRREAQSVYYSLARDDLRRLMGFLYETYGGFDTLP